MIGDSGNDEREESPRDMDTWGGGSRPIRKGRGARGTHGMKTARGAAQTSGSTDGTTRWRSRLRFRRKRERADGTTRWRSRLRVRRGRRGAACDRGQESLEPSELTAGGSVEKSRQRASAWDALRERAFRRRRRRRLWRGPVRRRGEWRGRRGGRGGRGSGHWAREVSAEWARGRRKGGWR